MSLWRGVGVERWGGGGACAELAGPDSMQRLHARHTLPPQHTHLVGRAPRAGAWRQDNIGLLEVVVVVVVCGTDARELSLLRAIGLDARCSMMAQECQRVRQ